MLVFSTVLNNKFGYDWLFRWNGATLSGFGYHSFRLWYQMNDIRPVRPRYHLHIVRWFCGEPLIILIKMTTMMIQAINFWV